VDFEDGRQPRDVIEACSVVHGVQRCSSTLQWFSMPQASQAPQPQNSTDLDHIKTHLKLHKDGLMQNLCFMGIFQARQQHTLDQGTGDGEHSGHGRAGPSGLIRSL